MLLVLEMGGKEFSYFDPVVLATNRVNDAGYFAYTELAEYLKPADAVDNVVGVVFRGSNNQTCNVEGVTITVAEISGLVVNGYNIEQLIQATVDRQTAETKLTTG